MFDLCILIVLGYFKLKFFLVIATNYFLMF
jgi:hypothetical protein